MLYEVELVDSVLGRVIEPLEIKEVIIPDDWDI